MGITIHYEGRLRSAADLRHVLDVAQAAATEAGWPLEHVALDHGTLLRVIDDEEQDYEGPVRGIVLHPHPDAEPLALLFGEDLVLQDYCKTQFAGADTHIQVVNLLRHLSSFFESLEVIDEGEYWETGDSDRLAGLFSGFDDALAHALANNPRLDVKVRLPSGRIIDAIE